MGRDPLYSHVAQMHQNKRWVRDPNRRFICDFCGKEFITKNGIKDHMLQHISKFIIVNDIDEFKLKSNFYC